jgi:eukaryotic-like serine/threonine-protein kinase
MTRSRIGELFEQAVELPPEERATWLATACGDDAGLRIELERLLRADARASDFMERPPPLVSAVIDASASGENLPRFGSWRALRQIGVGGMGEVWLAERDDGEFEQRVAVKQLAWPTPGLLQRFRQERQILARLQHPNIARLIDGGVDAQGAPYLVMEYIEGVPITDYVREHVPELRARLDLFLRVCDAVQYAHQNLVVHRDLKPSNIFVASDGAPKLLDFGIAKVLATTDAAAQTQTAARLLTPDYAAPEQFNGDPITTATDVYALGVVLYELLADTRPARPVSATSGTASGPLPPSAAIDRTTGAASARRRSLRGDLDRIAVTALAAEPQRRYPSVEAFAADIRRYLDGRPIAALRDSTGYRLRKFVRRNRYALAAATFVFAVCIAATAISVHQAQLAREQAQRATAVQQFLVGVFAQANPDANHGKPITAHQLLEKGEQQLALTAVNPAIEADIAALLARLYRDIGDNPSGNSLLERAVAASRDPRMPDDVRAHVLLSLAGAESEDKDQFDSALTHARQALAMLEEASDADWEKIADAQRIIALCLIRRGENDAVIGLLGKSIPLHRMHLGTRSETLAEEYVLQGVALSDMLRFAEADASLSEGAAMLRTQFGDDSNHLAYALNEWGSALYNEGDLARAEDMHRRVLKIHQDTLGPEHHNTLSAEYNLLGDIEEQGHFAQALPQRLELLDRAKESPQLSPIEKSNLYHAVAIDYRELGQFEKAEAMSRQALAMRVSALGPSSTQNTGLMRQLGLTLALQGRTAEAETVFRDALAIKLQRGAPTSLGACGLRRDIAQVQYEQHRYAQAIEQLQALTKDACIIGLAENDPWRPRVLADLSQAQLDSGDAALAYATAEQALEYGRKGLHDNYKLGYPLFARARAALALEHADEAEPLLREALALRSSVHPPADPRVLEVEVALVNVLTTQRKIDQARALTAEITPLLTASTSAYSAELLERLREN